MHQCSFKSNLGERSWYKDHLQFFNYYLRSFSSDEQPNLQLTILTRLCIQNLLRYDIPSVKSIQGINQRPLPPSHPWRMQKFIWTEPFCIHYNMTVFFFLAMESIPSYASGSAYGFSDKVIDGITVTVNSVILTLVSRVFTASIQVRWQIRSGH